MSSSRSCRPFLQRVRQVLARHHPSQHRKTDHAEDLACPELDPISEIPCHICMPVVFKIALLE